MIKEKNDGKSFDECAKALEYIIHRAYRKSYFKNHDLFLALQGSRVKYNQQHYMNVFNDPVSVKQLRDSLEQPSLLQLVEVIECRCKFAFTTLVWRWFIILYFLFTNTAPLTVVEVSIGQYHYTFRIFYCCWDVCRSLSLHLSYFYCCSDVWRSW